MIIYNFDSFIKRDSEAQNDFMLYLQCNWLFLLLLHVNSNIFILYTLIIKNIAKLYYIFEDMLLFLWI